MIGTSLLFSFTILPLWQLCIFQFFCLTFNVKPFKCYSFFEDVTFRFDFSILFPKIMLKDHTMWKEKISSLDFKGLKNSEEHNKINWGMQQFFSWQFFKWWTLFYKSFKYFSLIFLCLKPTDYMTLQKENHFFC